MDRLTQITRYTYRVTMSKC